MGRAGGPVRVVTPQTDATRTVAEALHVVPRGATVILAVSGGPDSVGTARLVVAARPDLRCEVVHVRHGLRDDAADAAVAAAHAQALGLPHRIVQVEVQRTGTGPEDAARRARWDALLRAASAAEAAYIVTGHTADDQAETVLLNVARGTGLRGAGGMAPASPVAPGITAIRPVLSLRRGIVRDVAVASGLPLADDPTNRDPQQRRSRARHNVLPGLSSLTGADTDPVESLTRLARHARRDNDALDALASSALTAAVRWGPMHGIAVEVLEGLHEAVATRVVRALTARAVPGCRLSEADTTRLIALSDGQGAELAGGIVASRGGGHLVVAGGYHCTVQRRLTGAQIALPEIGVTLRRGGRAAGVLPPWAPRRATACVPVTVGEPLTVRPRRPGDRVATAVGVRSVARAMAAAGVPKIARDLVPVVEDASGVLWVPGVAVRDGATGAEALHFELLDAE